MISLASASLRQMRQPVDDIRQSGMLSDGRRHLMLAEHDAVSAFQNPSRSVNPCTGLTQLVSFWPRRRFGTALASPWAGAAE